MWVFLLLVRRLRITFGLTVIGHGIIFQGVMFGCKAIGLWLHTPEHIGYRVIGNYIAADIAGLMPAGCPEVISSTMAITMEDMIIMAGAYFTISRLFM